jgi:hypothetical protein
LKIPFNFLKHQGHNIDWQTELVSFNQSDSGISATLARATGVLEVQAAGGVSVCGKRLLRRPRRHRQQGYAANVVSKILWIVVTHKEKDL